MHRKRIFLVFELVFFEFAVERRAIDAENPCRPRLLPLLDSISKKANEIDPLFSIFFGLNPSFSTRIDIRFFYGSEFEKLRHIKGGSFKMAVV
jgi:hypothetical protein